MIQQGDFRSALPFLLLLGLSTPAILQAQHTTWALAGRVFLDHNANSIEDELDFGFPAVNILCYDDVNRNHHRDDRDTLLGSVVSGPGGYFALSEISRDIHAVFVELDRRDIPVDARMSQKQGYVRQGETAFVQLSFQGRANLCYAVGDGSSPDSLMIMNTTSGRSIPYGGNLGTRYMEAMCLVPGGTTLFAVNKGRFGKIDLRSGKFITYADSIGIGSGEEGEIRFSDTDGLTYDPTNNRLYGSLRRLFKRDILYQIDTASGAFVPDAFGKGVDYVVMRGDGIRTEIDDIAVHPESGKMYGISNQSYEQGINLLVEIDKKTGETYLIDTLEYNGLPLSDVEGLGFDAYGRLFATTGGNADAQSNTLFEVSRVNGQASWMGKFDISSDFESCDCLTARPNRVVGRIFEDVNGNRMIDEGEKGLAGVWVYIGPDRRQQHVTTWEQEDSVLTDRDGHFSWNTYGSRDYVVRLKEDQVPEGYTFTSGSMKSVSFSESKGGMVAEPVLLGMKHNSFLAEWIEFTNQGMQYASAEPVARIGTRGISVPIDEMKPRKAHLGLIGKGKVVFYRMQILKEPAGHKSADLTLQSSYFQNIQYLGLGKGPLQHILMLLPDRYLLELESTEVAGTGRVCNLQVCSGSSTVLMTLTRR